eukprot:scaffold17727_cov81-Cyclotella_meneghiniana.AAC.1
MGWPLEATNWPVKYLRGHYVVTPCSSIFSPLRVNVSDVLQTEIFQSLFHDDRETPLASPGPLFT